MLPYQSNMPFSWRFLWKQNPGIPRTSWRCLMGCVECFFSGDIGALDFCESSTAGYQSPWALPTTISSTDHLPRSAISTELLAHRHHRWRRSSSPTAGPSFGSWTWKSPRGNPGNLASSLKKLTKTRQIFRDQLWIGGTLVLRCFIWGMQALCQTPGCFWTCTFGSL